MEDIATITGKRLKPYADRDDSVDELSRGVKRMHISGNQPDLLTGDVGK